MVASLWVLGPRPSSWGRRTRARGLACCLFSGLYWTWVSGGILSFSVTRRPFSRLLFPSLVPSVFASHAHGWAGDWMSHRTVSLSNLVSPQSRIQRLRCLLNPGCLQSATCYFRVSTLAPAPSSASCSTTAYFLRPTAFQFSQCLSSQQTHEKTVLVTQFKYYTL